MDSNAGRHDYDATIRAPMLAPGEPFMLIRGQDELSEATGRFWASLAHEHGVHPAVVEQALRLADKLAKWAPKKIPDAGHLSEFEAKQLAYELGRRAWKARVDDESADPRIVLAWKRGFDAAMGQVRQAQIARLEAERKAANG